MKSAKINLSANKVKEVHTPMSYETWVNSETGEARQFAVVTRDTADHGFHKVWMEDLAKILGLLGGSKISVFQHIIENVNNLSNEFGGTMREVAEATKVDVTTVNATFRLLQDNDFLKKVRNGTYKINPRILAQGKHDKRMGLIVKYNTL